MFFKQVSEVDHEGIERGGIAMNMPNPPGNPPELPPIPREVPPPIEEPPKPIPIPPADDPTPPAEALVCENYGRTPSFDIEVKVRLARTRSETSPRTSPDLVENGLIGPPFSFCF
jgi:hypothetical protein